MKNLKQNLVYALFLLIAFIFTGCAATQPSEPLNVKVEFDKITLNFIQKHIPRAKQYQSQNDVESKLNDEIIKNL